MSGSRIQVENRGHVRCGSQSGIEIDIQFSRPSIYSRILYSGLNQSENNDVEVSRLSGFTASEELKFDLNELKFDLNEPKSIDATHALVHAKIAKFRILLRNPCYASSLKF